MIDVPLSMKEIEIIRFVIERYRKAMIFEIANTDSRELKQYLRAAGRPHREPGPEAGLVLGGA